ncbi:MAG: hypothetical protein ACRDMZ_18615, partial [Solirubrobacteraceae bacterium]
LDDARGDKIELRAIPFASDNDAITAAVPPPGSRLPLPLPVLAGGGAGVLLLAGAIAFFLIRRRQRRQAEDANPTLALPAPVGELERVLEARPSNEGGELPGPDAQTLLPGPTIRDRVLQAVRADIDRTAGVLTAWLAEPPKKGAK